MNKNVVNKETAVAYEALREVKIAQDNKIQKTFRGQISTFGAAVTMGSLLPAIAFFSDNGGASVERTRLLDAILYILKKEKLASEGCKTLFDYAVSEKNQNVCKDNILNAAIALKLAMNLYQLVNSQ